MLREPLELKGKLSISRGIVIGSETIPDYIEIELEDERSGIPFLRIKVDFETFARIVTGSSNYLPVDYKLLPVDNLGKRSETKIIITTVYVLEKGSELDKRKEAHWQAVRESIAQDELEGWVGDIADCFNHHNFVKFTAEGYPQYKVHYTRFV